MAANRQTRVLSYGALASTKDIRATDTALREVACHRLPNGPADVNCSLHIARRALYQFTFIGLNEARCASEKLFEAQFGLRFSAPPLVRSTGVRADADASTAASDSAKLHSNTGDGSGAHRVAHLRYESLSKADQRRVQRLNLDDLQLYAEAKRIFLRRLRAFGIPRDVRCE